MLEKIYIDNPRYILVNIQKAIEHCPFKSDLPIKICGFYSCVSLPEGSCFSNVFFGLGQGTRKHHALKLPATCLLEQGMGIVTVVLVFQPHLFFCPKNNIFLNNTKASQTPISQASRHVCSFYFHLTITN